MSRPQWRAAVLFLGNRVEVKQVEDGRLDRLAPPGADSRGHVASMPVSAAVAAGQDRTAAGWDPSVAGRIAGSDQRRGPCLGSGLT